ncbi:MAG: dihydroorotase [Acidimicrobiia bacterium]
MSSVFAIINGTVIDSSKEDKLDVLISDGKIVEVSPKIDVPANAYVIDAQSLHVSPGFVDIQVHLREPGQEQKEDIESGSRAAALGGMTAVQCMPNTIPCVDNVDTFLEVKNRSKSALCDVFVSAAITKNRASEELAPLVDLYNAGARTFTDDGDCVKSARLMREAIELLSGFDNAILAQHCEDHSLVHDGVIDEGIVSKELNLKGRHRVAEEIIVARDIALFNAFASKSLRYHVLHLSTKEALALIEQAKNLGLNISTEVAPQHFSLTSELLRSGNANFKMNPPLREEQDIKAMQQGLAAGVIDAIATDHAPHEKENKDLGIELAPPGMLGVETAFSASYTHLVKTNVLTLAQLIKVMSINPSKIIGADRHENGGHGNDIEPGNFANITIFDTNAQWEVDANELHSKSVNSPYDTHVLTGKVLYTFLRGEMTCEKGNPTR